MLVIKRGMLPGGGIRPNNRTGEDNSPPASELVAIFHSTFFPPSISRTRSTETYFPLTLAFSPPIFSGQSGCRKGSETVLDQLQQTSDIEHLLFMKALSPGGSLISSLDSKSTTNVRGFVGGGVTYVNRQTSATCAW